jgi:hypothetical protein
MIIMFYIILERTRDLFFFFLDKMQYEVAHSYVKRGKKTQILLTAYKLVKRKSHQHHYSQYFDPLGYTRHQNLDFHNSSTNHYDLAPAWFHMIVSKSSNIHTVLAMYN